MSFVRKLLKVTSLTEKKMMFDPPDYPYKELNESIENYYNSDNLLFNHDSSTNDAIVSSNKDLLEVTEQMISNVESQLSFHSNENGRFFDVENPYLDSTCSNIELNTEFYVVQSEQLFTNENTLLDDNTVNQFLLPAKNSSDDTRPDKGFENNGPDILSLHSCVLCHEIFSTDIDLLDHTISVHASDNVITEELNSNVSNSNVPKNTQNDIGGCGLEADWLVCNVCERVLSNAIEVVPSEGLCCNNVEGKSTVSSRRLESMFVCDFCSGLFANGEALDKHRLACLIQDPNIYYTEQTVEPTLNQSQQTSQVSFICDTCGHHLSSSEALRHHQIDCLPPTSKRNIRRTYTPNSNSKMWNCGSCNQLFATARELYKHKRGEDRPPGAPLMAYVCEDCDKVLGSMCALHTHKKMHKASKPGYPCRVCGRRFNQSGHLAIHMRMHTGERPYPCDLCPKAFKVKVERDDHRRTHTGERPFACTACPKTFTAAARLREHARIHTDQRPYQCDICGASFRRPYARTVHTLIHTGEKPHACDICGTAFRRSGDMWKHKRTLHGIQTAVEDPKK